ncbi:MAG: phosphoribosylanthranilate isomerase [Methylophilaceae bacterium]|nr:phosphoribosylanthranilate isomerase [Methylophilaceae bacterium]
MTIKQRARVKICGITSVEDALSAVASGCDAIGLVFYAPSPRYVSQTKAAEIVSALPPFITVVGLFADASQDEIKSILAKVNLDCLQFHGDETPEQCRVYGMHYMKAIRVKPTTNLLQYEVDFYDAKALLLDTFVEGLVGGTGLAFDWNLIPETLTKPIVLAGGLTADNVALAIKQAKPYAVDVSGGVEKSKGVKDPTKLAAFMQSVSIQ